MSQVLEEVAMARSRTSQLLSAAVLSAAGSVYGAVPTAPAIPLPSSTPAPIQTASAPARPGTRVLVIPFNVLNVPEGQQWIGQGVQEMLIADLGRSGNLIPMTFPGQVIVEDNATAIRVAKNAGAAYAIRGSAQVVGNLVRITAQVIDVSNGDIVQTAAVTGATLAGFPSKSPRRRRSPP